MNGSSCAVLGQYRQFEPPPRQVEGPFEGVRMGAVDVPLLIRDLSLHGCLIELTCPAVFARRIALQIKLPGEGWVALRADILRVRHSSWLAAKFVNTDAATMERLARAIRS
jgi:hypothetical protein